MSGKERKALGRGFSALLKPIEEINAEAQAAGTAAPVKNSQEPNGSPIQVEIAKIRLNPKQPRLHFREGALEDLAQSIRIKEEFHNHLKNRIIAGNISTIRKILPLMNGNRITKVGKLGIIADPIFQTILRAREFSFTEPFAYFADGIAVLTSQMIFWGLLTYAYWRDTLPNWRSVS